MEMLEVFPGLSMIQQQQLQLTLVVRMLLSLLSAGILLKKTRIKMLQLQQQLKQLRIIQQMQKRTLLNGLLKKQQCQLKSKDKKL
jgi:hypothetical protein